ncbi:baseplate assembly protein [Bradyrhizobium valentinum]|uniref:Uncharacterized protein n=1 Tax=Bradyrhizobium valentinum TaxID=1518501 RepID=A0A0R3L0F6_9BRAD|nr:baseplate J/gp47 family protein [Bradyrhizobium valentinum]KRQ99278.1 hypothetical protein CP49_11825 [Bradyrhizobium valentinum]
MSSRFLAPDLTQLTPPDLIEEVSFETILDAQKTWVLSAWDVVRQKRPDLPPLDTLGLETEPMTIILQAYAYRETVIRALINDKARAVLLTYAVGNDLDHLGALFGTFRLVLNPAEVALGSAPIMESDDRFRRRIQLAPEAFSTVGPRGAYMYFALTLSPEIVDAWAYSPRDGRVNVVVSGANGADVSAATLGQLVRRFEREDTVPLTDIVSVYRAQRTPYTVAATVYFPRGPDPLTIETAVEDKIRAYAAERCRIGAEVYRAGLYAAAKIAGVENVVIDMIGDIICDDDHIPVLTGVEVTTVVVE